MHDDDEKNFFSAGFSALAAAATNLIGSSDDDFIMELDLNADTKVLEIFSTTNEEVVQVMALDMKQKIVLIATWNLE